MYIVTFMPLINPGGSRGGGSKSFQRQKGVVGGGSVLTFTIEAPPLVWLSAQPVNVSLWFHIRDNKLRGIYQSCFVAAWQSHFRHKLLWRINTFSQRPHHLKLARGIYILWVMHIKMCSWLAVVFYIPSIRLMWLYRVTYCTITVE